MSAVYGAEIELVRSDTGDGGWSLHAHRLDTDGTDSAREWPILVSGEAEQRDSGWSRPDADDYAEARRRLAALRSEETA